LKSYAIDTEGASEIDDALSIEEIFVDGDDDDENFDDFNDSNHNENNIENSNSGNNMATPAKTKKIKKVKKVEKIWIHIADVSRWIQPGSQLSIEAERRMSSVYMPDERISMFPETLASTLLSLGARHESFAISCGVVLDENGDVSSYEVCPSKIKISKKLTYSQLDDIMVAYYEKNNENKNTTSFVVDDDDDDSNINDTFEKKNYDGKSNEHEALETKNIGDSIDGNDFFDLNSSFDPNNNSTIDETMLLNTNIAIKNNYNNYSENTTSGINYFDSIIQDMKLNFQFVSNNKNNNQINFFNNSTTTKTKQQTKNENSKTINNNNNNNSNNNKLQFDEQLVHDISRLCHYSDIRFKNRVENGALDDYVRHKTELILTVKRETKTSNAKYFVTGYSSWSNSSSKSLVGEYMILMASTVGFFSKKFSIPVMFKTQQVDPPFEPSFLDLLKNETSFLRASRILRRFKQANDSKEPGLHASSGLFLILLIDLQFVCFLLLLFF
jgi:hypothetical protein